MLSVKQIRLKYTIFIKCLKIPIFRDKFSVFGFVVIITTCMIAIFSGGAEQYVVKNTTEN